MNLIYSVSKPFRCSYRSHARRHFIVDMFVDYGCFKVGCPVKRTQSKRPLMKLKVSFQAGNVLKTTLVGHGDEFNF